MTQHASLSIDRWRTFDPDQRLLMIANEMQRVTSSFSRDRARSRELGYERVLALTDLTIELAGRRTLRRELLRWRDLVAELFLRAEPDPAGHAAAFDVLLLLSPVCADQLRAMREARGPI